MGIVDAPDGISPEAKQFKAPDDAGSKAATRSEKGYVSPEESARERTMAAFNFLDSPIVSRSLKATVETGIVGACKGSKNSTEFLRDVTQRMDAAARALVDQELRSAETDKLPRAEATQLTRQYSTTYASVVASMAMAQANYENYPRFIMSTLEKGERAASLGKKRKTPELFEAINTVKAIIIYQLGVGQGIEFENHLKSLERLGLTNEEIKEEVIRPLLKQLTPYDQSDSGLRTTFNTWMEMRGFIFDRGSQTWIEKT